MTPDRDERPADPSISDSTQARLGPTSLHEPHRLALLHRLGLLDPTPEPVFDRLAALAQQFLKAPVCLISMVDDRHQYFKAAIGLAGDAAQTRKTPVSHSFCQHVVTSGRPLIVEDARAHPLVRTNLAIRDLGVIAYLGVPIRSADGLVLGSFCVIDSRPRIWEQREIDLLLEFAHLVMNEIAARHRSLGAESALQASKEQLHRVLGWADCLVWEAQVDCTQESWEWHFTIQPSGLFHRLFGERVPPPNVGLWYRFRLPDQAEMNTRSREAMLAELPGYDQEFRVVIEGNTIWLRESVTITKTAPEHFWLVGVATDITRARRAESELRSAQAQMQAVFDSANAGIAAVDDTGTFTVWNPGMEHLLGWSASEAVGHHKVDTFVPPGEIARLGGLLGLEDSDAGTLIRTALARQDRTSWETTCRHRSGAEFSASLSLSPIREPGGAVTGGVLVLHDLTERKRMETALARARDEALDASRMKSEFLANMSHEIRTPMNAIIGMAGLLMDTTLDENQRTMGGVVLTSADALLEIIDDILDFSKIEAGKLTIEQAPLDLRALTEDTLSLLALRAHQKLVELMCDVDADVPELLHGDAARIRQVLMNLAGNAVKFTEQGEVAVHVTLRQPVQDGRAAIRILVRDTGPGVPEETRPRLFQPFVQADGSHTRRHGGTGLGLAIARQLTGLMGGSIDFTSTYGQGSEFWVDLDLPVAAPAPRPPGPPGAVRRVLVVDDNATNLAILLKQLEAVGVPAQAVASPVEGLALLRTAAASGTPFGLTLLDWHMPGMSGLDFAAAVRADPTTADAPLVMLSSAGPLGDAARAAELRFEKFLVKPVRVTRLQRTVLDLLGGMPDSGEAGTAPRSTPATSRSAGTAHILIVEDNPANQIVAQLLLKKLGCTAQVAGNGREALDALSQGGFDAVLMDCQMPVMDGYTTTREIRSGRIPGIDPRLPVIALTAYAIAGDRQRCLDAGMDDYLTKPIRADGLQDALLRSGLLDHAVAPAATPASARSQTTGARAAGLDAGILSELEALPGRNGRTMLEDIIDLYLDLEPARLQELESAAAKHEFPAVARLAHLIAGSCANLGATATRAALLELENAAKSGDKTAVQKHLTLARDALIATHDAVKSLRRTTP